MAEEEGKKEEEKFEFDAAGEALGYISMAQARLAAMQATRETPGDLGGRFSGVSMAFEIKEAVEDEDYYTITLSFRPQGDFAGTPGQEQFFIEKEGAIAHRQVLALPRLGRRFPVIPVAIGLAVAGAVAVIAVLTVAGLGRGDDSRPGAAASLPTATSIPATQTPLPAPTEAPAVVPPTDTPTLALRPTDTPGPTPTTTPVPPPPLTDTPIPAPRPTDTPIPPRPFSKIAFESNRDGKYAIYTMNADDSNQTWLTFNDSNDYSPDWSADGARIAFSSDRDGNWEI